MIALAGRGFAGPFLLPLWSAAQAAGLFAVMVPGWRLLTFRALHFGEAEGFSVEKIRGHGRYAEWLSIAGTEWNLYIATHEMALSTAARRQAAARDIVRDYRPEFSAPAPQPERHGQGATLLARAMRTNLQE